MSRRGAILISIVSLVFLAGCGSPAERAQDRLAKAQELMDDGEFVKARLEALNAAQLQPKNAEAHLLLAEIAEQDGKFRDAIGHLIAAVDADGDLVEARVKLGNYYFLGKAVDLAAEQADTAMLLAPEDPTVRVLNARVLFLQGNPEAAMQEVNIALERDPDLIDAILFQAGLFTEAENYDDALAIVNSGIERLPDDAGQQLRKFRVALLGRAGRNSEVEAELQALGTEFPDEVVFQLALARLYITQDRLDDAEKVLREMVARDPDDVERRLGFAQFLAGQRSTASAEEALLEFIEATPDEPELRVALGRLYESTQRSGEALEVYQQVVDATQPSDDANLAARNRMVAIRLLNGENEAARALANGIIEDDPGNAEALLVQAAFKYSEQDYDGAIADLRNSLRKDATSERALLLLARSHARSREFALAQDAYRRLIELNPAHPNAALELAALAASQDDPVSAEEILRQRLEVEPDDPSASVALVQTLMAQGQLDNAETEARRLLEASDDSGLAEFQLGRVLQAQDADSEAITAYKNALSKNPEAAEPLQGLVAVLARQDRLDEAEAYLLEHIESWPDQVFPRFLLGSVYATQNRQEDAMRRFREVVELRPEAARAWLSMAALYPADANRRESIYLEGLAANPGNPELGLLLGSQYQTEGRYEDAIALYESLVEANPDNLVAVNNLAALMLDHRDDSASYARALDLVLPFASRKEPALLDTLGWAYYRAGEYPNAVRYLELAVAGAAEAPELRYHLGMAYLATENRIGARQELTAAVENAEADYVGIEQARAMLAQLEGPSLN